MFEVYVTPSGPTLVDNEQQIMILNAVFKGCKTFSDIQKQTNISKSTLSTNMKKLVAGKFLSIEESSNECFKETWYMPTCYQLIQAVDPLGVSAWDDLAINVSEGVPDAFERWVFLFMIYSTRQCGLSIAPLLGNLMVDIGRMGAVINKANSSLETALDKISEFFRKSVFAEIDVVSKLPLVLDVRLMFYATPEYQELFAYLISCAICGYLSKSQGIPCRIKSIEAKNDEGYLRIVLESSSREEHFDFKDGMKCDFTIYWNGKKYIPVKGNLDNEILAVLGRKRMSSLGMSEVFGTPSSTMSGYMNRLERDGLIQAVKVHNRVEYTILAKKVFDWGKIVPSLAAEGNSYLVKAWSDPNHCFRYLFCYFLTYSRMLGLDTDTFMYFIGKVIPNFVSKVYPNTYIEELFKILSENSHRLFSAEFAVTSYYPLSVVKVSDYSVSSNVAQDMRTFFNAFITGLLEKTMGIPYRIRDDSLYGEGYRGYRATFVPNPD